MTDLRDLRRRTRKLLRTLDIQPPLDVAELCRRFGEHRQRELRLVAQPLPPAVYALWLPTEGYALDDPAGADIIVYQSETTRPHQNGGILHEFGHIFAGHSPDVEIGAGGPGARHLLDTPEERVAEYFAATVLEWASVLDRVAPERPRTASTARLHDALGDHRGWM